jgi:hypothetical protein
LDAWTGGLPWTGCWPFGGSCACAASATAVRTDANETTIPDRLDAFILATPSSAVPICATTGGAPNMQTFFAAFVSLKIGKIAAIFRRHANVSTVLE